MHVAQVANIPAHLCACAHARTDARLQASRHTPTPMAHTYPWYIPTLRHIPTSQHISTPLVDSGIHPRGVPYLASTRPCILCVWTVPILRCKQAVGTNGTNQTIPDPALYINNYPSLIKIEQNNKVERGYVRFKHSIRTHNQRLDQKCESLMPCPVDLISSTEYLCRRPKLDKYISPSWLSRGSPFQLVPTPPARSS